LAHKASGRTVKVPAGTGGTVRDLRLFEEPCMFHPNPSHPLSKRHAGGPLGTGMARRRGVLAPHLGVPPNGIRTPKAIANSGFG
jgi:hypothetical protein